jgi:NADPH:quinone reductase-like Zn-dependent oxidoreductase
MLCRTVGVCGTSGIGTVNAIGSSVPSLSPNDNVLVLASGCWTDEGSFPVSSVFKLPAALSTEASATFLSTMTAYGILNNFKSLAKGNSLCLLMVNSVTFRIDAILS